MGVISARSLWRSSSCVINSELKAMWPKKLSDTREFDLTFRSAAYKHMKPTQVFEGAGPGTGDRQRIQSRLTLSCALNFLREFVLHRSQDLLHPLTADKREHQRVDERERSPGCVQHFFYKHRGILNNGHVALPFEQHNPTIRNGAADELRTFLHERRALTSQKHRCWVLPLAEIFFGEMKFRSGNGFAGKRICKPRHRRPRR